MIQYGLDEDILKSVVQTTDATATVIEQVPIPTDETIQMSVHLAAIKSDGSIALSLKRMATYKNDGGTVSKIGNFRNQSYERENENMSVSFVINSTAVQIKVTGIAATTITWKMRIELL